MKHTIWLGCGFALLFFANRVGEYGDRFGNAGDQMTYNAVNFFVIAGAMFCFIMGWRGAMAAIHESKESEKMRSERAPRQKKDPLDDAPLESSFDADAALARYLEERGGSPRLSDPAPQNAVAERTSFGRKRS